MTNEPEGYESGRTYSSVEISRIIKRTDDERWWTVVYEMARTAGSAREFLAWVGQSDLTLTVTRTPYREDDEG